ncbi:response regulator [Spongiibacter sp. KMU-158]|uniref:Response regulator n=1 Tax=Spongiibacter pelagi TaxID=2760804 RepID=A0A927BYV6_9GAMM|nr:HD domain-containing phosphohydrolase [Spongiibacter pelagi]MBD2858104.1 response regulator [Spongiibacter pelagi]
MRQKILVVDDESQNLELIRQILKDHYKLAFAKNARTAMEAAIQQQPDLILLDIMMPETDGYEVCTALKAHELTKNIPVIFVTAMSHTNDESKGFDVGAVDYITKPVSAPLLLRRVKTHLSLTQKSVLEAQNRETVFMLGKAGHYNDTDTGVHIWRMAEYSKLLALKSGWDEELAECLALAAPMHDTGKIGIPDEILKAPRKLNDDEFKIMEQHTTIGFEILREGSTPLMKMSAEIALSHHENWDGSGYPLGLIGNAIPESARIVSVADVFDALTMQRPYKKPWTTDQAMNYLKEQSGTKFEPRLVDAFVESRLEVEAIMERWKKEED